MNEDSVYSPMMEPNLSPQAVVDNASIANCMNKNKESLKVKLMLRRPIDVLVDQGILPPPKSTPTFYEQRQKLERAKTVDFLKHKIQRRPQRDELIQQHILEDSFDPSYYEQERRLKKARLADDLNERLSQRPGPLELIKGNILHTDETLEQAIKEGQITFKKTCEGEIIKNPPKRFVFEEESSSDSAPSPHTNAASPTVNLSNQSNLANSAILATSSLVISNQNNIISVPQTESTNIVQTSNVLNPNLSYIVTTPVTTILTTNHTSSTVLFTAANTPQSNNFSPQATLSTCANNTLSSSNFGTKSFESVNTGPIKSLSSSINTSHKIKKKVKSKNQPKARIIKFHEYTGPPNVRKQSNSSQLYGETSYELLLKQQQLFLQWQLECNQKYPHLAKQNNETGTEHRFNENKINSMDTKPKADQCEESRNNSKDISATSANTISNTFHMTKSQPAPADEATFVMENKMKPNSNETKNCSKSPSSNGKQSCQIVKKIISKLEDMKVSDLKAELKKRNLPVSGAKQQLIERLKPFSDTVVLTNNSAVTAELNVNTIFNITKDCKSTNQLSTNGNITNNSNNITQTNLNTIANTLNNSTTLILNNNGMANNDLSPNMKLGDEFVLVTNDSDNLQSVPLHVKPANPITLEAPTLTIPFANPFIPQYQIVSSTPVENKINLNGINIATPNAIQPQLSNNILMNNKLNILNSQPSLISTNLSYNQPANQMDKNTNFTFLAAPPIQLAPLKNGLSFNITQPVSNKLVTIQNPGSFIHQLLLYNPTTINTTQDINSSKQRSNSLPNESLHQLQRNTSLPIFINQVPLQQVPQDITIKNIKLSENILQNNLKTNTTTVNVNKSVPAQSLNLDKNTKFVNLVDNKISTCQQQTIIQNDYLCAANNKSKIENNKNLEETRMSKKRDQLKHGNVIHVDDSVANSISSTNVDFSGPINANTYNSADSSSSITDNPNKQIQPDSTTNSGTFDLDFILNFDGLNDDVHAPNEDISDKSDCKLTVEEQIKLNLQKEEQRTKEKNDEMTDFSDNWFEMTFGESSTVPKTIENIVDPGKNSLESSLKETNSGNSFLETINQFFDQNYTMNNNEENDFKMDFSKHDPIMSNNSMCASNSSVNSSRNSEDNISGHYSATNVSYSQSNVFGGSSNELNDSCSSSKPNTFFNNSSNAFNVDSFGDYFFEENDFKNSIEFPIMLDKIDFAT